MIGEKKGFGAFPSTIIGDNQRNCGRDACGRINVQSMEKGGEVGCCLALALASTYTNVKALADS